MMQSRALQQGLTLDVAYRGAIPDTIQPNPNRLRQILINLIATRSSSPRRRSAPRGVHGTSDSPARPQLRFDVIDTGLGLTADQQENAIPAVYAGRRLDNSQVRGHRPRPHDFERLAQCWAATSRQQALPARAARSRSRSTRAAEGVAMLDNPGEAVRRVRLGRAQAGGVHPPGAAASCWPRTVPTTNG